MTLRFGDLDDLEMIERIERSFQIKLPASETFECYTFGDLFDCVAKRVSLSERGACLSARTFRLFREALGDRTPGGGRLRPSTPIAELAPGAGWRRWRRALQSQSDLEIAALPTVARLPFGYVLWFAGFAAAPLVAMAAAKGSESKAAVGISFLALALVGAVAWSSFRRVDPRLTIADLIRENLPYNVSKLAAPGRPIHPSDAWNCLEAIARAHTGYAGPIDRRTRFEHV